MKPTAPKMWIFGEKKQYFFLGKYRKKVKRILRKQKTDVFRPDFKFPRPKLKFPKIRSSRRNSNNRGKALYDSAN